MFQKLNNKGFLIQMNSDRIYYIKYGQNIYIAAYLMNSILKYELFALSKKVSVICNNW